MIHDGDGVIIRVGSTDSRVTDHNRRLCEVLFDKLHDLFVDSSRLLDRSGLDHPFLPGSEICLDECRCLIHRHVTDDSEDDLVGKILFGVEVLHIRQGNLAQRFLRPVHRPTIGMILKDQLIEGLRHYRW
jgi:hypothetical protein